MEFAKLIKAMLKNIKDMAKLPQEDSSRKSSMKELGKSKDEDELLRKSPTTEKYKIRDINTSKDNILILTYIEMFTVIELI